MNKVWLRDIKMGDVFSRCEDGYLYTLTTRFLVRNGETYPICYCFDSGIEYAWTPSMVYLQYREEEQTMEEVNKVYKPLVETGDGRLVSIIVGTGMPGVQLEYKEGTITYSPEGGDGIWVNEDFEKGRESGRGNKSVVGVLVVHEVIPLGERCGAIIMPGGLPSAFSLDTRYPAILLDKEVWRETPPRPEPKFSEGQRVVVASGCYKGTTFDIASVEWGTKEFGSYHTHYHYYRSDPDYSPLDEDKLEEAKPEPEWVDVTKECEVTIKHFSSDPEAERGFWIELTHNGETLMELGLEKTRVLVHKSYQIEDLGSCYGDLDHQFRILRKVLH